MPLPKRPSDVLALAPMSVAEFMQNCKPPLQAKSGFLVIDLNKSTADSLHVKTPSKSRGWYTIPTQGISTLKALEFVEGGAGRWVLVEVVWG